MRQIAVARNLLRASLVTFSLLLLGAAGPVGAVSAVPEFDAWLEEVRVEARQKGISEDIIKSALSDVTPVQRILKRDRNQAEFKLTLNTYMKRVVTKKNVARGRNMAQKHQKLLEKISARYGVQSRFILAIWGIETRFGLVTASMPVIPAVATLAFDRRRSKYFRQQLFSVLWMLHRGHIDLPNLKGSWAGAMGQPQFMPSSYLAYAQDFDGDGRRDIWNNTGDVLASIANYLAKHRWSADQTWGREVRLPDNIASVIGADERRAARGCRAKTSERRALTDWQGLGVRRIDGSNLPTRNIEAALVRQDGRAFLVYGNYASIMAYNCAHLYALTVGILSDRIAEQ
jgi:membrane-bound lytic murein transglycosylase B